MKRILITVLTVFLLLSGCALIPADEGYRRISQETAKEMMEKDDGHVVVDVRRRDEYESGHIPGAILIPNEEIGDSMPEKLPDLHQIILIYCRTGNRSKQAAAKLARMGYTGIYEFGGITEWTGEIVTGPEDPGSAETFTLSYSSFSGGGYDYTMTVEDPSVLSFEKRTEAEQSEEPIDGGNYTVCFELRGIKQGETELTVSARSPILEDEDYTYHVAVDKDLTIRLTETGKDDGNMVFLEIGEAEFEIEMEDNSSADAFIEKLREEGPLTVEMSDYGDFEKVGPLPWELPRNDERIKTKPGDLILYQGDQITVYYDENTWTFTKLGSIPDMTREELLEVLGSGNVEAVFRLERSTEER